MRWGRRRTRVMPVSVLAPIILAPTIIPRPILSRSVAAIFGTVASRTGKCWGREHQCTGGTDAAHRDSNAPTARRQ